MADTRKLKIAIATGASEALRYKERNPHASDSEVLGHITKKMNEIISNIEE